MLMSTWRTSNFNAVKRPARADTLISSLSIRKAALCSPGFFYSAILVREKIQHETSTIKPVFKEFMIIEAKG